MNPSADIQLVIFDWAGTTVDFGSCAPAAAFTRVFADHGVTVTDAVSRGPMGANKRDHMVAMLSVPEVAAQWRAVHGRDWGEADVDVMYREFIPVQLEAIRRHAALVPDLPGVVETLRARGVRIGGTTGYFRQAADAVLELATAAGFAPDANVCADDVPEGRPAPWMIFRVMERLGVYPPAHVVNVGDTVADIKAGLAAGCWSVGVCDSSSVTGLSESEFRALSAADKSAKLAATAAVFRDAGCHAVIPSLADLPSLIGRINGLLETAPHPVVLDAPRFAR